MKTELAWYGNQHLILAHHPLEYSAEESGGLRDEESTTRTKYDIDYAYQS